MAAEQNTNPTDAPADDGQAKGSPIARLRAWRPTLHDLRGSRDLWQVPISLAAFLLLALGVRAWISDTAPPDYHRALDAAEQRLDRREYDEAIAMLNGPLRESIDVDTAPADVLARFFAIRGDALYLSQKDRGASVAQNYLRILENYDVAERKRPDIIDDPRRARIAGSLLALERPTEALAELERITDPALPARREIIRRLVEDGLEADAPATDRARATDLLTQIRNDPSSDPDDRLWAILRQTRISLDAGFPEHAVRRLLPEIQRAGDIDQPRVAEMFVLLGRAYLELGHVDDARRRLAHAESVLQPSDPDAASAQVLLAQIDRSEGNLESARDRLTDVAARFLETDEALDAWTALGGVEAEMGNFEASVNAFEQAVTMITRSPNPAEASVELARSALAQRHRERFERDDFETALRYASLAERLHPDETPPADVTLRLAETHRNRAEQLLADAPRTPSGAVDVFETDPSTLEQARGHFAEAGDRYGAHARAALLGDPEASADSLWLAADSHDRAGDIDRAAELFAEYVEVRHDDERRLEGVFRLARAHQAQGRYAEAVELYESLLNDHPTSRVSYRSYVPLAQSYLLRSADGEFPRAEELLMRAVSGEVFAPEAPEFREALVELGQMYRRVGEHDQAIRRLGEAVDRYPDLASDPEFVSGLAGAHRLASASLAEELGNAMPNSERRRLEGLRAERLRDALTHYERARDLLAAIPTERFNELHDLMLRNALLYRGDCAYDLGLASEREPAVMREQLELAIRYYDTAAQRYAEDPASLVAMIQIVNCYAALGKWREVRTAHERARARLAELPEDAFEESGAPMNRRYWEQWLDAAIELDRLADANAGP